MPEIRVSNATQDQVLVLIHDRPLTNEEIQIIVSPQGIRGQQPAFDPEESLSVFCKLEPGESLGFTIPGYVTILLGYNNITCVWDNRKIPPGRCVIVTPHSQGGGQGVLALEGKHWTDQTGRCYNRTREI